MLSNLSKTDFKAKLKNFDIDFSDMFYEFYKHINVAVDEAESESQFLYMLEFAFKSMQVFNSNKSTVIINPDVTDGCSIVFFLAKDMRFIIRSIEENIRVAGYNIIQRIDSIIALKRDNNGSLVEFSNSEGTCSSESISCFAINEIDSKAKDDFLCSMRKALDMVEKCDESKGALLSKSDEALRIIQDSKLELEQKQEITSFINWLKEDNFVFLSMVEYKCKDNSNEITSTIGLIDIDADYVHDNVAKSETQFPFYITRSDNLSKVYRCVNMDMFGVREFSKKGEFERELRFMGIFLHDIHFYDIRTIPLVRMKVDFVIKSLGFAEGGYHRNNIISILQDFPRAELFHVSEDQLIETCNVIMSLYVRPRIKLLVHKDEAGSFIRCLLYVPNGNFSDKGWKSMIAVLSKAFDGIVLNHQMKRYSSFIRLQLIMKVELIYKNVDLLKLEQQAIEQFSCWRDNLIKIIKSRASREDSYKLIDLYSGIFSARYQNVFNEQVAFNDLLNIEKVHKNNAIVVDFSCIEGACDLKMFVPFDDFSVSKILPAIENMSLKVSYHYTYRLALYDGKLIWMHHFVLEVSEETFMKIQNMKEQAELTLLQVFNSKIDNDIYNALVIQAGIDCKEANLLRALGCYLKQIKFEYGVNAVEHTLVSYPEVVSCIVELFHIRFSPNFESNDEYVEEGLASRKSRSDMLLSKIEKMMSSITELSYDKVIRAILTLIDAIVRTNFYLDKNNLSIVSFKFNSCKIPFLPEPKPFFEIYVFSNEFEAVHLRGGMVSRGGLRWSSRIEDFRTEVLGLMKAQMPKNAVIVPTGAKGGFIVKEETKKTPDQAINCYRDVLRSMLDLTDNRQNGKPISDLIIKHDQEDSYLVVAADKGTARFSDAANHVSQEYGFWLGDAFASGGSSGYDHKEMGITARGAFVSLERHFWEMGISIEDESFTVVGIGDMSGDVFGNGMLLSDKIKLIAAFNHMHIFIDPDPDPYISFEERKRMYDLPISTWKDYNHELISAGGGVFNLKSKSITVSDQMKKVFDISVEVVTPQELINKILKARVDVIWNGGIGTYVKSSSEDHASVSDKENDNVRVNGCELRAKMIVEGGNLGCTQLGRIEYSRNGGRINTDFLDNSAGVSCSDMEVNIKIVLDAAVEIGKISFQERNKILSDMTEEVAVMVLRKCNHLQIKSISVSYLQNLSGSKAERYRGLISKLEDSGILTRELEFLPDDGEIAKMCIERKAFEKPEIAVITAYTKMLLYAHILESDLPDDKYFNGYLIQYFPLYVRENFKDFILNHPLKREIVANYLTNSVINRMGCIFVHDLSENLGLPMCEVVRVYMAVREAFSLRELWYKIDSLDHKVSLEVYVEMATAIHIFVEKASSWLLRNYPKPINISLAVSEFSSEINLLSRNLDSVLDVTSLAKYNELLSDYEQRGVSKDLSQEVAKLTFLSSSLAIINVARDARFHLKINIDILAIAKIYFYLGEKLNLKWLRSVGNKLMKTGSHWHKLSVRSMCDDIYDHQMRITSDVVRYMCKNNSCEEALDEWFNSNQEFVNCYDSLLNKLKSSDGFDLSKMLIIIKRLSLVF